MKRAEDYCDLAEAALARSEYTEAHIYATLALAAAAVKNNRLIPPPMPPSSGAIRRVPR